jgi:Family of unknown function (DUF6328)
MPQPLSPDDPAWRAGTSGVPGRSDTDRSLRRLAGDFKVDASHKSSCSCGLHDFLIAPAAYHRIALNGEDNEEFYRMAGRSVIIAMVWLALAVCGDLYVVAQKTTGSSIASALVAVIVLVFFHLAWFGYSHYKKRAYSS